MIERTAAEIAGMRRRELAEVHAAEMKAALFPYPGRADDDIGNDEKAAIQTDVRNLVARHRSEIRIWQGANT